MKKILLCALLSVATITFSAASAPVAASTPAAATPAVASAPVTALKHHAKDHSHNNAAAHEEKMKKLNEDITKANAEIAKLEGNEKIVAEADMKAVAAFMDAINNPAMKDDNGNMRRLTRAAMRNLAHANSHVKRATKKAHKAAQKTEKAAPAAAASASATAEVKK